MTASETDSSDTKSGASMPLSLPEELLLLLLNDSTGKINIRQQLALDVALGGAVLMDLALHSRIDSDLTNLWVTKKDTPTGHLVLDEYLQQIAAEEQQSINTWVHRFYDNSHDIRNKSLELLVKRGILVQKDKKYLWVFEDRRYPVVDGRAEREVKLRIMQILFSNDIPDSRDISIISLCNATGFFEDLLATKELGIVDEKIYQISKMDLVSHAISEVISDFIVMRMQPVAPY